MKPQRIRDPIHNLIRFNSSSTIDMLAWRLIDSAEFQRLRRVKQLGFTEYVFPGGCHTRFSHSIGVFHVARTLVDKLKILIGDSFSEERANIASIAALLHDIGHGPFSHTFEGVLKAIGKEKKHEVWSTEIIEGPSEISRILEVFDSSNGTNIRTGVIELLKAKDPKDIYSSIVSSQLDADRIDYLQRDQYATGVQSGRFDSDWLLDSLIKIRAIIQESGEADTIEVDALGLDHKGLQAAEGYLLARYHLYYQVYLHKTTRSAERMLSALLQTVSDFITNGRGRETGLDPNHPLMAFFGEASPSLGAYLALDDHVLMEALSEMARSSQTEIASLAIRLRDRKFYKCFDAGLRENLAYTHKLMKFKHKIGEKLKSGEYVENFDVLIDETRFSCYGIRQADQSGALQKILIRKSPEDNNPVDVADLSEMLSAIGEKRILRIYARDAGIMESVKALWEECNA